VDLIEQFNGKAPNPAKMGRAGREHGMMVSMGGNDMTVTALVVRKAE